MLQNIPFKCTEYIYINILFSKQVCDVSPLRGSLWWALLCSETNKPSALLLKCCQIILLYICSQTCYLGMKCVIRQCANLKQCLCWINDLSKGTAWLSFYSYPQMMTFNCGRFRKTTKRRGRVRKLWNKSFWWLLNEISHISGFKTQWPLSFSICAPKQPTNKWRSL